MDLVANSYVMPYFVVLQSLIEVCITRFAMASVHYSRSRMVAGANDAFLRLRERRGSPCGFHSYFLTWILKIHFPCLVCQNSDEGFPASVRLHIPKTPCFDLHDKSIASFP